MNFGWYRMLLFNESFIKLCVKALYFFFFSVITFKLPIEIKCIFLANSMSLNILTETGKLNSFMLPYHNIQYEGISMCLDTLINIKEKFIEDSGQPPGRESVFLNRELCTNE